MQKSSTQLCDRDSQFSQTKEIVAEPKKSTIKFLKEFARVYTYEKKFPLELGNFIAN